MGVQKKLTVAQRLQELWLHGPNYMISLTYNGIPLVVWKIGAGGPIFPWLANTRSRAAADHPSRNHDRRGQQISTGSAISNDLREGQMLGLRCFGCEKRRILFVWWLGSMVHVKYRYSPRGNQRFHSFFEYVHPYTRILM